MAKFILLGLSTLFLSSCFVNIVNDNYYSDLTRSQQAKVKHLDDFEKAKPGYVYKITGSQLMENLKNNEKSIVYIFANSCSSDACLPLSQIRDYAQENDLELFLVMNGYYKLDESLVQKVGLPLYSINAEAYGETKSRKYSNRFKEDIGYHDYLNRKNEKWMGNYVFYEKHKIVEIKKSLNNEELNN